ncbi:hypothetical protein Goe25_02550 [Bacillus phage vB_BsuM-Goe25]|nr:hypothetical protein Goe25_00110 [Bacillus phage vB_BsuM-Goe25]WCS69883.1 hypothetical protein Goe25_02550 [Bacillus phage vB_BsuM-Goe25]
MTRDMQELIDRLEDMQTTYNDMALQYEETGAEHLLDDMNELELDIEELQIEIEIMQEYAPYEHMTGIQRDMKLNGLSQADFI